VTATAGGGEVSDVGAEEVVQTQEEDIRLALLLSTVTAADKVCYVCIFGLVTLVQVCSVASSFWKCVVWFLVVTVQ
jgi:hypothetical protein